MFSKNYPNIQNTRCSLYNKINSKKRFQEGNILLGSFLILGANIGLYYRIQTRNIGKRSSPVDKIKKKGGERHEYDQFFQQYNGLYRNGFG